MGSFVNCDVHMQTSMFLMVQLAIDDLQHNIYIYIYVYSIHISKLAMPMFDFLVIGTAFDDRQFRSLVNKIIKMHELWIIKYVHRPVGGKSGHTQGLGTYWMTDNSGIWSMIHRVTPLQHHISKTAMLNSFHNHQTNGIAHGYDNQASINLEIKRGHC